MLILFCRLTHSVAATLVSAKRHAERVDHCSPSGDAPATSQFPHLKYHLSGKNRRRFNCQSVGGIMGDWIVAAWRRLSLAALAPRFRPVQRGCADMGSGELEPPGYNIQSLFRILPQHTVALRCVHSLELPQTGFLRGNQWFDAVSLCRETGQNGIGKCAASRIISVTVRRYTQWKLRRSDRGIL